MTELKHEKCPKCKHRVLYTESERENGICDRCADKLAESYNEQQDWNHWHND